MKRLLILLLVLDAAFVGGSYLLMGRVPWVALSGEERQMADLQEAFRHIRQRWKTAGRTQALGVDASSRIEGPLARLEQPEKDLGELAPKLRTPEARTQAQSLRQEIALFRSEMR
ncbi:MAG TPA: hypothetical protein VF378_07800 [Geothrix sp.]